MKFSLREKLFCLFAVLFFLALLVSLFLPAFGRMTPRAYETKAVSAIKNVLLACRSYAADHDGGVYPPDLAALIPDYLDDSAHLSVDNGHGTKVPLTYFPGFHSNSDPGAVVIECPVRFNGNRIVGIVGGHVRAIPAD